MDIEHSGGRKEKKKKKKDKKSDKTSKSKSHDKKSDKKSKKDRKNLDPISEPTSHKNISAPTGTIEPIDNPDDMTGVGTANYKTKVEFKAALKEVE